MNQTELAMLKALPLEIKVLKTQQRIREWYQYYGGEIYVAFSGGKDSTVLLHLARQVYPNIVGVFADTGLEYPELREFVKTFPNIETVRPSKTFKQVIEDCGYPVISKLVSRYVHDLRNNPSEICKTLRLQGIRQDGEKACSASVLAKKWWFLLDAPFKISNKCCDVMKKGPFHRYEKATGKKPLIGTMAHESRSRELSYVKNGCNAYSNGRSTPMAFWSEQDVLQYIKQNDLPICSVYGTIEEINGLLHTTGERRTGCMFCMFGVTHERGENRFQRMKRTHPKLHTYCMEQLKLREVLDYIRVPYE